MNDNRKRWATTLIILALSGLLVLSLFSIFRHRGETLVNIIVSPRDSMVTVDGVAVKSGKVYVKNGTRTLKASRQYFTAVTKTINTNDFKAGQVIYLIAGADSPEALKWLEDHPDEATFRESAGSGQADAKAQEMIAKYPFLADLPYQTLDYKIDYSIDSKTSKVSLQVTLNPVAVQPGSDLYDQQINQYKDEALQYLKNQGVDTTAIGITFIAPE
jgi:hypothetical protein